MTLFAMPRRRRPSESKFSAENYARCKILINKKTRDDAFCNAAKATAERKQIFSRKLCALQKASSRVFAR
jgi:hypothetical protein